LDLTPDSAVREETPQRLAESAEGGLRLALERLGRIGRASVNQSAYGIARSMESLSQVLWQHLAGIEVGAHALGEIRAAIWTEVHAIGEKVRPQLELPVALGAWSAFGNDVIEAVPEEECPFFWTHRTRPPAVQMDEVIAVEREGVVRGNGLLAPPALRLSSLSHRRSWRSSSLLATPTPSRKIATLMSIR